MKKEKENRFINLIEQNKGMILMICKAYVAEDEDVDDYFQDVVIKLWESFDTFRGDSEISTWIYRVTLNTCISFVRKRNRRLSTTPLLEDIEIADDDSIDAKNTAKLYQLINCLNKYEKALVLLWLENLSYVEIADIMGLTVSNVSVKLTRIKEKLKSISNQTNY